MQFAIGLSFAEVVTYRAMTSISSISAKDRRIPCGSRSIGIRLRCICGTKAPGKRYDN